MVYNKISATTCHWTTKLKLQGLSTELAILSIIKIGVSSGQHIVQMPSAKLIRTKID